MFSTTSLSRAGRKFPLAAAAAALVATGLFSAVPAQAGVPGTIVYPLAQYSDWNVVSFGDLDIHAESEGPVAVGGNLTFSGTNVAFKTNTDVALLVGGQVNLAQSSGALRVNSQGSIKIGDLTGNIALDTDQNHALVNTQVVAAGSSYGSTPAVASNHRQDASTVSAPGLFASTFNRSDAAASAALVAAAASGACNADHVLAPTIAGGRATVTLGGGANYWNFTTAELSSLGEITFGGPVAPSLENPLIVNVTGSGPVALSLNMAGSRDPRGILFNLPDVTSIVQGGDSIDGSILAPNAVYTKTSANLQGTAIVAGATLGGSEEHFFPFGGFVTTCDPSVPTTPVVTPTPTPTSPVVTPTPTPTPTSPVVTPTPTGTPTPVPVDPSVQLPTLSLGGTHAPHSTLAFTGANALPIAATSAVLFLLGLVLTIVARRRAARAKLR